MFKKQKGITLIALVITIIVLLILAGVSISLVVGENGVLNKATTAKEETIISQESETVKLAAAAAKVDTLGGEILEENLARELTNLIGTRDVDYSLTKSNEQFLVTYLATNRGYLVNPDGEVTGKGKWYTEVGTDINGDKTVIVTNGEVRLEIGDYIDYNHIVGAKNFSYTSLEKNNGAEDQTYELEESYAVDGKWQVIGATEAGEILITTEKGVKTADGTEYIIYNKGFENAEKELNNISKIFGQGYGAVASRSITIEDINKVTGYNPNNVGVFDINQTGSGTKYGEGESYEYGNKTTYYWNGKKSIYHLSSNGNSGDYGYFYDGEILNWYDNGWKNSTFMQFTPTENINEMKKITTLESNYYEYYGETLTDDSDSEIVGLTMGSKAYDCVFATDYWCASPKIKTDGYPECELMLVGATCGDGGHIWSNTIANIDLNVGGYMTHVCYVRPVVTLDKNIQLTGSSEAGWHIVK